MTTELGNAKRVQKAYRFLAENYKDGDKVYIFGFSRSAWSARILSAMLYVAGLPDLNRLPESTRVDVVDDIYYKYKRFWGTIPQIGDHRSLAKRRSSVLQYLSENNLTENHSKNVTVDFLGLWDFS
ncbi:T6SS phospholipase effector Tle1-like catalytic domain-containing protein [Pseudoalteromonas sp. B160]|uniref:T6SS phospholipase effector Tle1-like catalytic domain-containing protein n=1 Tax=Pseudoalteromonas sp. B160 TaxID=630414 RepID=UPI003FA781A3